MSKELEQKQIEEMAKLIYGGRALGKSPTEVAKILQFAGYRKQSEWISVDERLPEETEKELEIIQGTDKTKLIAKISEMVLVYSNYPERPYITIDRTVDGTWSNNWYVTHWIPLPEAPKLKGGE
jgi:hypothetical protein